MLSTQRFHKIPQTTPGVLLTRLLSGQDMDDDRAVELNKDKQHHYILGYTSEAWPFQLKLYHHEVESAKNAISISATSIIVPILNIYAGKILEKSEDEAKAILAACIKEIKEDVGPDFGMQVFLVHCTGQSALNFVIDGSQTLPNDKTGVDSIEFFPLHLERENSAFPIPLKSYQDKLLLDMYNFEYLRLQSYLKTSAGDIRKNGNNILLAAEKAAADPACLSKLIRYLSACNMALCDRDHLTHLIDYANEAQGCEWISLQVLGGCMMVFGAAIAVLGAMVLTGSLGLIPTGVLALPGVMGIGVGSGLIVGGASMAAAGLGFFCLGRQSGLSRKMTEFGKSVKEGGINRVVGNKKSKSLKLNAIDFIVRLKQSLLDICRQHKDNQIWSDSAEARRVAEFEKVIEEIFLDYEQDPVKKMLQLMYVATAFRDHLRSSWWTLSQSVELGHLLDDYGFAQGSCLSKVAHHLFAACYFENDYFESGKHDSFMQQLESWYTNTIKSMKDKNIDLDDELKKQLDAYFKFCADITNSSYITTQSL